MVHAIKGLQKPPGKESVMSVDDPFDPSDPTAETRLLHMLAIREGTILSHYKILSKLGEGGMGIVYRAEDTRLKRTVALKFLPPDLTRDREAKRRFVREAQAASALDHPNICNVHEIVEADGICYRGEGVGLNPSPPAPLRVCVGVVRYRAVEQECGNGGVHTRERVEGRSCSVSEQKEAV